MATSVFQAFMNHAILSNVTAGAAFGVFVRGRDSFILSAGRHTFQNDSAVTKIDDMFDMASCSKVVCTTLVIMKLYEKGLINLDAPLVKYLPDFANERGPSEWISKVTVRHVLAHCAGLPPDPPKIFTPGTTLEERRVIIMNQTLDYEPGTKSVYSDIDFMLLYELAHFLGKERPEVLAKKWFYDPLGMKDTQYNPPEEIRDRCLPTERIQEDPTHYWTGIVHDENARHVGGIDGHAGLFSTVPDLMIYAQMLLNKGIYNNVRVLEESTVELFSKRVGIVPDSSRALGFDTVSGSRFESVRTFGHTGFTGTCIWMDPDNQLAWILLTNAVHPERAHKNNGFFKFRNNMGSLVYETFNITK